MDAPLVAVHTPDEKLALIANSLSSRPNGDQWKLVPDDTLLVVDLTAILGADRNAESRQAPFREKPHDSERVL
jgi:hypothetical protein